MNCTYRLRSAWTYAAIAILALLLSPRAAMGQMSDQMVGGPISTKRFQRLLGTYVHPTESESAALDRLHEAYLDRFRAEIDPELSALLKDLTSGAPSLQEFRRLMRETERMQARIGEADRAFFDSAAALLPEGRRAGLARVRTARERQRALAGFTGMSSSVFGGRGSFVDLADLMARDRVLRAVPADMRARFDALLMAQEQRLLTQAQRFDRTTTKALDGYYEAMLSLQAPRSQTGSEGETPEQQEARRRTEMQNLVDIAAEFGEEPRKVLEANFAANRAALAELAGVLPAAALAELRTEAATRSLGDAGRSVFGASTPSDPGTNPAVIAARLRRSGALDQEGTERSRAIVDSWRVEHAQAIEEYVEARLESSLAPGATTTGAQPDPGLLRVAGSAKAVDAAGQKALRALAELAGARASEFLVEREEQGESRLAPTATPESADSVLRGIAGAPSRVSGWFFQSPSLTRPMDARELGDRLALLGVKSEALAMIESVVAAWKTRECDIRFAPAVAAWSASSRALATEPRAPATDAASRERRAVLRSAFDAARSATVDAYFATEDALLADLAAALALDPDGPELTALRLTRIALLDRELSPLGESGSALATPLPVIAQSGIGAESGMAFLTQSLPAWRALAESIPARVRARLARTAELERLQWVEYDTTDSGLWNERIRELDQRISSADLADATRIRGDFDGALSALESVDPAAARALRTAAQQIRHPDLHRPSESAAGQLAQALALEGVDDATLARLEALKGEYDSVFEALTQRMVDASDRIAVISRERFEESVALRESLEKLRFQRNERAEKARGEARRILGDGLASRIRGLVPNEDDELLAPRRRGAQSIGSTSGDDD